MSLPGLARWQLRPARAREVDEEHPFGYGRDRYIYAFIVAIVLFSVGGLFALYEAFHKFEEIRAGDHEEAGRWWWVPLVVLGVSIVLESLSLRTAVAETDKVRGEASFVQFIRRARQPELPVILLEDVAALTGLVFALLAVSLSLITGNYCFDVAGTTMIGLLLVVVAVVLALETKSPAARRVRDPRGPGQDPGRAGDPRSRAHGRGGLSRARRLPGRLPARRPARATGGAGALTAPQPPPPLPDGRGEGSTTLPIVRSSTCSVARSEADASCA